MTKMKRIYDWYEAYSIAMHKRSGTFKKKDGAVLKGRIISVVNEYDDDDGIGYIGVETKPDKRAWEPVYANEFEWAEFDD